MLSTNEGVANAYLYRRHTHGVAAFILRAECANADVAKTVVDELRIYLAGSEFLKASEMRTDVDSYEIIVNGDCQKLEENAFGVA